MLSLKVKTLPEMIVQCALLFDGGYQSEVSADWHVCIEEIPGEKVFINVWNRNKQGEDGEDALEFYEEVLTPDFVSVSAHAILVAKALAHCK